MTELVLIVEIAGRRAALRSGEVHSVVELETVQPVPRSPRHILGLSALRSNTLTVVDAALSAGVERHAAPTTGERSAVVDYAGHRYAILVDGIDDVAQVSSEPVPVPGDVGAGWSRVAEGLIETDRGPALLLSLRALVAGPSAIPA